ncbi:hypothetical protein SE956_14960 [Escherichia coli]|nr:hypothetical protein [Escherichia coli]
MILLNFITTSLKAPEFVTFSLLTGKWAIGNQGKMNVMMFTIC